MMRIDRLLVNAGIGSRTEVHKLIRAGKIAVNGITVKDIAQKVDEAADTVTQNNNEVRYGKYIYIMMNKPAGYISATEDRYKKTVLELLPDNIRRQKIFPAGRLDIDTVGLLILTNDGELAHRMLSPARHVTKTYYVEAEKEILYNVIPTFNEGIDIGDYKCLPAEVELLGGKCCNLKITEGKYHQVKRMFEAVNNRVTALKRISMGNVVLDEGLCEGGYRILTDDEVDGLRKLTGL